ncbi:MAG: hypothetical protein ABI333_04025 [bacterium]
MVLRRIALILMAVGFISCGTGPEGGTGWDSSTDVFHIPDAWVQMDSTITLGDGGSCVTASYVAEQAPLALMVVLDKSASMQGNRWNFASQAIVQALDQDVFDTTHLGLYAAPSGMVGAPPCISWILPTVGCQAPAFPQKSLTLAGTDKSTAASGIRREIKDWLANEAPLSGDPDGTPLYDAILWSSSDLQGWPVQGKRVLLVVTDGSISCTSLSTRQGYMDANGCADWEYPQNIVGLVTSAEQHATAPVLTFVIGVPGSDTYDPSAAQAPPYYMRGALSSIALAGAPAYMSPTCDATLPFVAPGANPTESCHFDMTQGNFTIQAVSDAISWVRGQTVGCTYELPDPPGGLEINEVNVRTTIDGNVLDLARRSDPSNECASAPGCWDYDGSHENVELVGAACDAVQAGQSVQVDIILGCQTIVQ